MRVPANRGLPFPFLFLFPPSTPAKVIANTKDLVFSTLTYSFLFFSPFSPDGAPCAVWKLTKATSSPCVPSSFYKVSGLFLFFLFFPPSPLAHYGYRGEGNAGCVWVSSLFLGLHLAQRLFSFFPSPFPYSAPLFVNQKNRGGEIPRKQSYFFSSFLLSRWRIGSAHLFFFFFSQLPHSRHPPDEVVAALGA